MKLDVGCGKNKKRGFIGLDISKDSNADIIASALRIPIKNAKVKEINCSHLVEHFYPEETQQLFDEFYRVLEDGGIAKVKIDRDWTQKRLLKKDSEHKYRYNEGEIQEMVNFFSDKKAERRIYRLGYRLRNKIFVQIRK